MPPVEKRCVQMSSPTRPLFYKSLFSAAVFILAAMPLCAAERNSTPSIRSSVFALNSARQRALHELESLPLSTHEASDYQDFIVYLNTRIANDCRDLAEQGGATALEGLNCPAGSTMIGAGENPVSAADNIYYTIGPGAAETKTQAEKTAELDGDFLSGLGAFDEMLLKEEDKIAARVPSQRESPGQSGATTGNDGLSGTGEVGEAGEQGEGSESGAATNGQQGQSEPIAGTQSNAGAGNANIDHSAYGAAGGKLPPPQDDDIVARQLREAAEKEPDPELKKKLFEEYWKYKGVNK